MIKEWVTEKIINGKRYRLHYVEQDHYGGARVSSSWRTEIIDDEESDSNVKDGDDKNQGEYFEERQE